MSNGQSTSTPLIPDKAFLADVLRAEADALQRLAESVQGDEADRWTQALDLIDNCPGHVVVSGMGKSGLVGAKISATLASVGVPSHVVHPADAVHGDLGRIRPGDIVLLLSFSGGTEEIVNLANILRADQVTCIGISRSHDSHLARLCDVHLARRGWESRTGTDHINDSHTGLRRRLGAGSGAPESFHRGRLPAPPPRRRAGGSIAVHQRVAPIQGGRKPHHLSVNRSRARRTRSG